jgi:hypothetical protein
MKRVALNVDDLADEDDALVRLHEILYGNSGSRSVRKRNVLSWTSKIGDKRHQAMRAAISETPTLTVLKEICVMLDINVPTGRPAIEAAIYDFLLNIPGGVIETVEESKTQESPVSWEQSPVPSFPPTPSSIETEVEEERPIEKESVEETKKDETEVVAPVRKRVKRGGRRKGSRNKTPEEREAERLARLSKPKGKPGRKKGGKNRPSTREATRFQRRGRPLNFNEGRAFRSFVKNLFPNVLDKWLELSPQERESYWVRHRFDM